MDPIKNEDYNRMMNTALSQLSFSMYTLQRGKIIGQKRKSVHLNLLCYYLMCVFAILQQHPGGAPIHCLPGAPIRRLPGATIRCHPATAVLW